MTPHGSYSTYTNHACRCDECRQANARHQRRRVVERQHQLGRDGYQPVHGLNNTYSNWGCRCDDCRSAHARYERNRRRVPA